MSARTGAGFAAVVCTALFTAFGAIGCLSDDTSVPNPILDASIPGFDSGRPAFDASGSADGTPGDHPDAGRDAAADAAPIEDASPDAARPTGDSGILHGGLVVGGSVARSKSFVMNASAGPATAPVLHSKNYSLVGGMSVSTQKP